MLLKIRSPAKETEPFFFSKLVYIIGVYISLYTTSFDVSLFPFYFFHRRGKTRLPHPPPPPPPLPPEMYVFAREGNPW